ncbi:hypothetical protein D3C72_1740980 [compost metagenome]
MPGVTLVDSFMVKASYRCSLRYCDRILPSRSVTSVFHTRPSPVGTWMHIMVDSGDPRLASSRRDMKGPSSGCAAFSTICGSVMSRASIPSGRTRRSAPPARARSIRSTQTWAFSSQTRPTAN